MITAYYEGVPSGESNESCSTTDNVVSQDVVLNALQMNFISFNIEPEDASIASVFANNDLLILSNDNGQYYAPNFGVDQIGDISIDDAYGLFPSGMDNQMVSVSGAPVNLNETTIVINAAQFNMIPYLPQGCLDTDAIFTDYESSILIVKDDSGSYYVPGFGVMTLAEMCPGQGYEVFLSSSNDIDFSYLSGDMARANSEASEYWSDYRINSVSTQYEIVKTGISHPIIITDLSGSVQIGDELVAYDGNMIVGATKVVDLDAPVVIAAWGGYHEFGIDLDGYTIGDKIDLRLWSESEGRELRVMADLDEDEFGVSPLTVGTANVSMENAIPTEVNLSQNYPNPFNPTTRIDYSVVSDGHMTLNVYDITGRLVSTLVDGYVDSGYHSAMWDGIDNNGKVVAAGIYFYSLQSESSNMTRKMVYMK